MAWSCWLIFKTMCLKLFDEYEAVAWTLDEDHLVITHASSVRTIDSRHCAALSAIVQQFRPSKSNYLQNWIWIEWLFLNKRTIRFHSILTSFMFTKNILHSNMKMTGSLDGHNKQVVARHNFVTQKIKLKF